MHQRQRKPFTQYQTSHLIRISNPNLIPTINSLAVVDVQLLTAPEIVSLWGSRRLDSRSALTSLLTVNNTNELHLISAGGINAIPFISNNAHFWCFSH